MLVTIVLVFGICWLPLHIFMLIMDFNPHFHDEMAKSANKERLITAIYCSVHWLAMSNSFVNPIIYGSMNESYRADLRSLLFKLFPCCKKCYRRKKYHFLNLSGRNHQRSTTSSDRRNFDQCNSPHLTRIVEMKRDSSKNRFCQHYQPNGDCIHPKGHNESLKPHMHSEKKINTGDASLTTAETSSPQLVTPATKTPSPPLSTTTTTTTATPPPPPPTLRIITDTSSPPPTLTTATSAAATPPTPQLATTISTAATPTAIAHPVTITTTAAPEITTISAPIKPPRAPTPIPRERSPSTPSATQQDVIPMSPVTSATITITTTTAPSDTAACIDSVEV